MAFFQTVMSDHSAKFPTKEVFANCKACPFLYRLSQSCPTNPDLYTPIPPDIFTEEDLIFPMKRVFGHPDYRT